MIRARSTVENPDGIGMTIAFTMTIGEWKKLSDDLEGKDYWPSGKVAGMVQRAIHTATKEAVLRLETEGDGNS